MTRYFFDIFAGLTNTEKGKLNISPYDIPAILEPVVDFRKVPLVNLFDGTAFHHVKRTEPNYTFITQLLYQENYGFYRAQPSPILFSKPNYFGKILGPHLKAVMEIMYHCLLKPRGVYKERYNDPRLQDLFSNMKDFLRFEIDDRIDEYSPTWKDYKANNKTPYFYQYQGQLMFERGDFDVSSQSFNGGSEKEDGIIEELKKKYQLQQMMLACHSPGQDGQSCQHKFQPVLTDSGICYAFNARNFSDAFVNNTYTNMFRDVFQPVDVEMTMNRDSGKSFRLTLILDSHQKHFDHDTSLSKRYFTMAINQATDGTKGEEKLRSFEIKIRLLSLLRLLSFEAIVKPSIFIKQRWRLTMYFVYNSLKIGFVFHWGE